MCRSHRSRQFDPELAAQLFGDALRAVDGAGQRPADVDDELPDRTRVEHRVVGDDVLDICACDLEELRGKLGINPGETDASGTFTLMEVECLGACDRAPAVMVNDAWQECVTPESAARLIDDLRARGEEALSGCHHVIEKRTAEGSGPGGKG